MSGSTIDFSFLESACSQTGSELDVGVFVSHYINPANSINFIRHALDAYWQEVPASADELLGWFSTQGFGSSPQGDVSAANSDLVSVLQTKTGIPISQALLLIGAARFRGLSCAGVNYPGHFLVRLESNLVDPLTFEYIDAAKLGSASDTNAIATPRMIALRMFNNLKGLALHQGNIVDALEIVDAQMIIANDAESRSSLNYERGEYWLRLGAHAVAREAFEKCAEECPYPELAERARQQAESLQGSSQTLH